MDHSIEEKWQKRWKESRVFEPSMDGSREKFLITVPWPYTNGSLHVGHGKTYTTGDFIARYKRMRNFNVLYPMGFHQSGTPILAYSEKLSLGDRKTISLYRSYLEQYEKASDIDAMIERFKDPAAIAQYFSDATVKDFTAMGYSIDWTRRFTSAEETFQDFVQWQFRILEKKNYIKQGKYPILYSLRDENAVGEDDILDGDVDKVTIEEFTAVKFRGKSYSLVAASLRPETIFGITNIWINGETEYTIVKHGNEMLAVSSDTLDKITRQMEDVEIVKKVDASDILSQEFEVPITREKKKVYSSSFVDPDNGTGIVYSVPGHSIFDYIALREKSIGIEPVKLISMPGKATVESLVSEYKIKSTEDRAALLEATQRLYKEEYYSGKMMDNCGPLSGMSVVEARNRIIEILKENGGAFTFYEVSRKAETRSGSKVIVAVLRDQWFIDYSVDSWKKSAHELIDRMLFVPSYYRAPMHEAVDWLRERPCARRRGIGTKLPFDDRWTIESLSDSTIYPAVYTTVLYLRKIREKLGKIPDSVFDRIYLGSESGEKFDAETEGLVEKARSEAAYWYGVDMRMTAIPHFSNHLVFYILNHAAVLPEEMEPRGLSILGLLVSEGHKIGKSKGNVVNLLPVAKKYSADIYRLYVAIMADISSQADWNEKDLDALIRSYDSFIDLLEKYRKEEKNEYGQAEKWFISRFYQRLNGFMKDMDEYSVRSAYVSIFYEAMNDLRRVEKRGGSINSAVGAVMKDWLIALSAVMPHTCEEYWNRYIEDSFVSVQTLEDDYSSMIDGSLIHKEAYLDSVIEDVRSIISVTGREPKSIRIKAASEEAIEFVKTVNENRMKDVKAEQKHLIPEFMKVKKLVNIPSFGELAFLKESSSYIGSVFNCPVEVAAGDLMEKGKKAWPGRPSILIEN